MSSPIIEVNMKKRRSNRLLNFDYSASRSYFITICTHKMNCIFGDIISEKMLLNECGEIAKKYWSDIPEHFHRIEMDEFIIMPNHIHGIINIIDDVGSRHSELDFNKYQKIISGSIGSIIRSYKSAVTKWVHQNTSTQNVWLRNYYEHIIQNDKELDQIREYIKFNPLNWQIKKNEHLNKYW